MTQRNHTYQGFKLTAPARAFGIKRLKGNKYAAFVVNPDGTMFRGEARNTWEECELDLTLATAFTPERVYAREPA